MKIELLSEKNVPARITDTGLAHRARARERTEGWHAWQTTRKIDYLDWSHDIVSHSSNRRLVEWTIECAVVGSTLMNECVHADPGIRGGRLVLKDTGFTVAQLLAEIASTRAVDEVADDFSLDADVVRKFLGGLSLLFERSWAK